MVLFTSCNKKSRYEIQDVLGKGGQSIVYRAFDRVDNISVALKVMERSKDNAAAEQEERLGRRLHHSHIIRLLDSFKTRKHYYLVYELLEGKELFDHIVEREHFSETEARVASIALIEAVAYLHDLGVVHRDIKPENILYRSLHGGFDDFVLADFGMSATISDPNGTVSGHAGSPGYLPPEMLNGQGSGRPGDMWSAGLVIYAMLSGRTPFVSTDPWELQEENRRAHIVYPNRYWAGISDDAKDFVQRLLTKDPAQRMTADQALEHPWLAPQRPSSRCSSCSLSSALFERSASQSSASSVEDEVNVKMEEA